MITAAQKAGILVMLDMHLLRSDLPQRNSGKHEKIPELWHNQYFSERDFIKAWEALLYRCGHRSCTLVCPWPFVHV